jgi:hypothetical protein
MGRMPFRCRCCERRFYVAQERQAREEAVEVTVDE